MNFLKKNCNNTIKEIKEQKKALIKKYQNIFNNRINEIIEQEIRGIPEYKIHDWIEEFLIDKIYEIENIRRRKIEEFLEDETLLLIRELNKNEISPERLLDKYEENLKIYLSKENASLFDDIVNYSVSKIVSKILYYCDPFNSISQDNIENKLEEIKYQLKSKIRKLVEQYIENSKEIHQINIKKNCIYTEVRVKNIAKQKQIDLSEEEIQKISEKLENRNFKLIKENDKLYIEKIVVDEIFKSLPKDKIEVEYNQKTKTFKSIDDRLTFQLDNEQFSFTDKTHNQKILIKDNIVICSQINDRYSNAIIKKEGTYCFFLGGKFVKKLEEISSVIKNVKNWLPKYYNELLSDHDFKKIVDKIEKYEQETEEIYKDEKDGIIKINPKNKDKVIKKLRLAGFMPIEKKDGLYLKNLITDKEHKMKTCYSPLSDEVDNSNEYIYTNIDFVYESEVSPNNFVINRKDSRLVSRDNLRKFLITIKNEKSESMYRVDLTETGLVCKDATRTIDTKEFLPKSSTEEILSNIKAKFPFVAEYFEQHLLKVKKSQTSTDDINDSDYKPRKKQ